MPFDFVDFDVRLTNKPQKFYRVRQAVAPVAFPGSDK